MLISDATQRIVNTRPNQLVCSTVFRNKMSGPRVIQLLLLDPTQVESKKSSQIQWPVPSINAEPVDIFLGEE